MRTIWHQLRHHSFLVAAALIVAFSFAFWLSPSSRAPEKLHDTSSQVAAAAVPPVLYEYIEVIGGCGPYFDGGECVGLRAGPGFEYRILSQLRLGVVLKVEKKEVVDGLTWYKIAQRDEWLRYPERVGGEWYVPESNVRAFLDAGSRDLGAGPHATSIKHIIVDRSDQILYAYDGDTLYTQLSISTGIELTPTPRGTFTIYRKTPSRYMQGPLPGISDKYYDLPGVPWNLYFTEQGGVIHGAYWHNKFGQRWSSGCVNLPLVGARAIYDWADVGTEVIVRD